ncbi:DUF4159 domain-containing protein [Candidatus Poribacteria bacterium]|nr:DUF4159 domain-containing protein [Candidatus Poribacteria bacterium]MYH81542.1 DUF4159 domain-containing protein [Candidatus Poribacteria bacterium]MYK93999.1 DUF4159 domain-containing protein [Candidatus Poribacteria bacterium]
MKQRRFRAVIASIGLHLLFALIVALLLSEQRALDKDAFQATLVKLNPTKIETEIRPTHRTVTVNPTLTIETSTPRPPTQVSHIRQLPKEQTALVRQVPRFEDALDSVEVADVPIRSNVETPNASSAHAPVSPGGGAPIIERTTPPTVQSRGTADTGFTEFLDGALPTSGLGDAPDITLRNFVKIPKEKLGGILEGTGNEIRGVIRLIRLKHSLSDWWQDPTAIPSLIKWLEDHTPIRADMDFAGGALRLTDPEILDAPLIIMTGHDKDITVSRQLAKGGPLQTGFTPEERVALRKYILERGGMLFFDDCGFNGLFAHIVADELRQIFPEYPLEIVPHDHELYSIHYHLPKPPTGGDVFWGNENNAQPTQFRFQKGITIDKRLAVVYNRKDYMCAMETAEIESRTMLRLRRSTDVYRFMSNLLIYALKYGGNTDRTAYTE